MELPHKFPSLLTENTTQLVIISGAGLSAPNAPVANQLYPNLQNVARELGLDDTANFYELANAVLQFISSTGKSEPESRLYLAEKLGLLDDRRWFGEIGLPLSGNTPRHRVIARFAIEERWKAIISLNWDTLLEAALESVGLSENGTNPRPWKIKSRASIIDDTHLPLLKSAHVFPVIKPHGCVRNLAKARQQFRATGQVPSITFKLTQPELDELPLGQNRVDKKVETTLSECPLLALGWKASEGYLRKTILSTLKASPRTEDDAFSLVSRSWYETHDEIASAYGKDKNQVFFKTQDAGVTLDRLFLWLQAQYAIGKLMHASNASRQTLQSLLAELEDPRVNHYILNWVDGWLSTWNRLCWRAGLTKGTDPSSGQKVEPWEIPVVPRDVHVPLCGLSSERLELEAAALLLAKLSERLADFNYVKFPGGFWKAGSGTLYIPLPVWDCSTPLSDLAALKPLIDELRGFGFIRHIYLIAINIGDVDTKKSNRAQLAAQLSRLMPLQKFAKSDAFKWLEVDDLKENQHGHAA